MVGGHRGRPKSSRGRRSIVADEEFVSKLDSPSFPSLFPIGFTKKVLRNKLIFNENVENSTNNKKCTAKRSKNDENIGGRRKAKKRNNKTRDDSDSLPTLLKEKIAEINEINDNYELHITNESTSSHVAVKVSKNKSGKSDKSDKSDLYLCTNTMQIGTSTPSIFGRADRKPNIIAEISQIEMMSLSTLFENSQICIPPEAMMIINVDSGEHFTENRLRLDDDIILASDYQMDHDDSPNELKIQPDRIFNGHRTISDNSNRCDTISDRRSDKHGFLSGNQPDRLCVNSDVDERVSDKIASVELSNILRCPSSSEEEITRDLFPSCSYHVISEQDNEEFHSMADESSDEKVHLTELEDQLCDLVNDLSVDKLKHSMNNTTKQTLQTTKSFSRLSFTDVCSSHFTKANASASQYDPRAALFQECGQEDGPISWDTAIPDETMEQCVKIGEGTYGEVFKSLNSEGESVAFKIIPIEGDFSVNDEPQKSYLEILPEILIAKEMSNLKINDDNKTPNFVEVKNVFCVEGPYPEKLLGAWDDFAERRNSENDRPDMFGEEQLFVVFEFADGGTDLENFAFSNCEQAKSVLIQLMLTMAIAEKALEFEHRDLHIGNVLVKKTDDKFIEYEMDGNKLKVKSAGIHVYVIDFTNSRFHKDGCTIFTDLAADEAMFSGEGDYQFEIYRMLREINKNEWKHFEPKTNLVWLHYITDKLCKFKKYRGKSMGAKWLSMFNNFADELFLHLSCEDFVENNSVEFFNEILFL